MKYRVSAKLTISAWTDVEAENLNDALEAAENRSVVTLPHLSYSAEEWTVEELDGTPFDFAVEPLEE